MSPSVVIGLVIPVPRIVYQLVPSEKTTTPSLAITAREAAPSMVPLAGKTLRTPAPLARFSMEHVKEEPREEAAGRVQLAVPLVENVTSLPLSPATTV